MVTPKYPCHRFFWRSAKRLFLPMNFFPVRNNPPVSSLSYYPSSLKDRAFSGDKDKKFLFGLAPKLSQFPKISIH